MRAVSIIHELKRCYCGMIIIMVLFKDVEDKISWIVLSCFSLPGLPETSLPAKCLGEMYDVMHQLTSFWKLQVSKLFHFHVFNLSFERICLTFYFQPHSPFISSLSFFLNLLSCFPPNRNVLGPWDATNRTRLSEPANSPRCSETLSSGRTRGHAWWVPPLSLSLLLSSFLFIPLLLTLVHRRVFHPLHWRHCAISPHTLPDSIESMCFV